MAERELVVQRVLIGAILIALVFGLFWLDARLSESAGPASAPSAGAHYVGYTGLLHEGGLITLVAAVLVAMATFEMIGMCRSAGMNPAGWWAILMAVLLTIHPWLAVHVPRLLPASWRAISWPELAMTDWTVLLLVIALIGSVGAVMARRRVEGAVRDVAATWFTAVYIGFLASFAVRIRQEFGGPTGAWILLYFIAVVKFTDIFAYASGMLFGRHKLIAWLSPGKTVEGLVGGLAGGALTAVVFLLVLCRLGIIKAVEIQDSPTIIYMLAAGWGLVLGGLGQLGDLMESLLKRGAGQKDSARLLPGFGGAFDLLDSLLVAAPAAWLVFLIL